MEDDAETDDEAEPIVVTALDDDDAEEDDISEAADDATETQQPAAQPRAVSKRGRKKKQPQSRPAPTLTPPPALPAARGLTSAGHSRRGRKRKTNASNVQTLNTGFDSLTAIFQHLKVYDLMRSVVSVSFTLTVLSRIGAMMS